MKRAHSALSILLGLFLFLIAGCRAGDTASSNTAKSVPAGSSNSNAANANHPDQTANANATAEAGGPTNPKASAPAQLLGTYESREVHDKGVVTLISQLKTFWRFSSDGTYSRMAEVKGKPYHADSGTFRVEAPDKLVLSIQVTGLKTQRKIQNPPLSKTHKFSLSADGDELRLTSEKGSVGVFWRVAKPKTQ